MKTVTNKPCFQGDLMIRRIAVVPTAAVNSDAQNGYHVVAHSETGHNHVVLERSAQMFIDQTNAFIAYLDVADEAVIEHLRSFDTHEALKLPAGKYEVRRQREYIPEGYRRAAD
jgi:hypothetical protein